VRAIIARGWGGLDPARFELPSTVLAVDSAPIPQKKLSIGKLSAAITRVTTDVSIQERADLIGRQIRSEDGVANAVDFINRWLER
jgi:hypothetical protein